MTDLQATQLLDIATRIMVAAESNAAYMPIVVGILLVGSISAFSINLRGK